MGKRKRDLRGKSFVWFDLGYTLVYKPRERVYRSFLRENGIDRTEEEVGLAYHLADKYFMRAYPGVLAKEERLYFPWYLGVLNHKLGVEFGLSAQYERLMELQQRERSKWQPYPFSESVLRSLKRGSIGVGLISNWDATARRLLDEHGLAPYFDAIGVSSEVGWTKPEESIFRHSFALAGVAPEECVYVGDNYYDDIVGSARVGMDAILVNRYGRLGIEEIDHEPTVASIESLPEMVLQPHSNNGGDERVG
ncbi:HAD family hydrolase [Cohnella faecalis]|uniref:HAD family hydrolase n=1 Tax=Cohnella faecalis TaxID=2315694 RepID=A0A398CHF0_9BACL|nr:HAD-IA family hydrolase [Cohnella faecalis]RIE01910.1 HAD family hydrolase [Cohnella faecalis]